MVVKICKILRYVPWCSGCAIGLYSKFADEFLVFSLKNILSERTARIARKLPISVPNCSKWLYAIQAADSSLKSIFICSFFSIRK